MDDEPMWTADRVVASFPVPDIKEKEKIKAKTRQNQARNEKRRKVNQVKAKVKVKPVKTGHGFGKSAKNQSRRHKYLIGPTQFISENSDAAIESFSPSPIPVEDSDSFRDEIDLSLTMDDLMPPGIEDDDYDSEGDILILEELFSNYSLSLPENKSFHFDILSSLRPPAKPSDADEIEPNLEIFIVKVEIYSNPLFDEEIISIKVDLHHFNPESDLIESLLNQDSSIISSSKIDSLLDEFARELIHLKSIPPGINEVDCDPKEEIRLIKKL
nr:hypothetical protein [Tanacetum cinerariifolium]